jgi:hypothetical protein
MESHPFIEQGSRLLAPAAFEFVLESELKRAVRAQNFLTLVVMEARREWEGLMLTADPATVGELAEIVAGDVRDTDLLGRTENGFLSLLLIDSDFDSSIRVVDRLMARIGHYDFPTPMRIAVGAACYPTHAVDSESLRRQAVARPVVNWRGGPDTGAERN